MDVGSTQRSETLVAPLLFSPEPACDIIKLLRGKVLPVIPFQKLDLTVSFRDIWTLTRDTLHHYFSHIVHHIQAHHQSLPLGFRENNAELLLLYFRLCVLHHIRPNVSRFNSSIQCLM